VNHHFNEEIPRYDVQLLFNEIGIVLDDNQYRDVISLVDMYRVYMRQHQVGSLMMVIPTLTCKSVSQISTDREYIYREPSAGLVAICRDSHS
jgi:hypothetical protein